MIPYATTDKTDRYMEYLRFSITLELVWLLSKVHSSVLSIKEKEERVDGLTLQDTYG